MNRRSDGETGVPARPGNTGDPFFAETEAQVEFTLQNSRNLFVSSHTTPRVKRQH